MQMQCGAAILLKDNNFAQFNHYGKTPAILMVSTLVQDPQNPAQLLLGDVPDEELKAINAKDVVAYENINNLNDLKDHRRAWRKIGLRLVKTSAVSEDVFVRIDETRTSFIGDYDTDDDEEMGADGATRPGMCGYVSDDGFVVPDGTQEFTQANPNESEFVADVHEAVNEFNDWSPAPNTNEYRFRAWMEQFERSITHKDDDEQFKRGKSVNHRRPPMAKGRSKRRKKN